MPRPRTGSLERRADSYYGRLFIRDPQTGAVSRPWYKLNTLDEDEARRLLDQLNAQVKPADAPETPGALQTFGAYAAAWRRARVARGVAQAESEKGWLDNHILPVLGPMPLGVVRAADVRKVVEAVVAKKLSRQTVTHVRATVSRILDAAWRDEMIPENPALRVRVPPMREVTKPRVILTDAELLRFFACDDADLEIRMLGLAARVEGGMRTRDLTAWDWTHIDQATFASCIVPRTKTGKPQRLEVPGVLQAPLRAWWLAQGSPASGPVFPVTRGKRKGEARRSRGVSFADRLRRALMAAGIKRHACEHPDTIPTPDEPCCPTFAQDELYAETAWSLPVDFHSFRRAFKTALAEAGIATEHAMHLSGSSDPRTHARYVMQTPAMQRIPAAAVPSPTARIATGIATASDLPPGSLGAGHGVRTRDPQLGKRMHVAFSRGFRRATARPPLP
jgi:integrase